MSYLEKAKDLQNMVLSGQLLDAFEKYYAEDVVMVEGNGEVTTGKDANREREKKFLSSVEAFHGAGVEALAADEDAGVTMVEVWMDVTFQGGHRMKMEQVSVQRWKGDHIVHERFYYNAPGA